MMASATRCLLITLMCFVAAGRCWSFSQNRGFSVDTLTTVIDGSYPPYNQVLAGDTLLLEHGKRDFILLRNFQGEAGKPVVVINNGGIVNINTDHYFGISVRNCRYIKFTGTGDADHFYGIKIERVGHGGGIGIGSLSSDFEIDHVSIENCLGPGINAKTDPDCSFTSTRDKFTQFNSIIHDNYISGVSNEGLYVGSSKYFGQTVNCEGRDTLLLPSLLDGVRIFNNIIRYTGWDGIQVSSASSDCQVFDNTIIFDSQDESYNQMSGILLGGGSKCDCFNNYISQGKGNGIENHGLGGNRIFNNIIVDAGRSYMPLDSTLMRHGIYISDVSVQIDSSFSIINNDIINPKSDGIRFASILSKHNLLASNLIINPGSYDFYENGNTSFKGKDSYIMLPNVAADVTMQNNYLSRTAEGAGFSDIDYTLLLGSPLIDSAYFDNKGVVFDFYHHPRPYGTASDIGAFEFIPAYFGIPGDTSGFLTRPILFPNPARTILFIQYKTSLKTDVFLDIYSLNGIHVKRAKQEQVIAGRQVIKVDVEKFEPGIFLYTLRVGKYSSSGKFVKW